MIKRYNDITINKNHKILSLFVLLPILFSCGASPNYSNNIVKDKDGKDVTAYLSLGVFNEVTRDTNYNQVIKGLTLKEHEDMAYKADVSRSISTQLHSSDFKYDESNQYVISLDYKKEPLKTYFDDDLNLKDNESQKFKCYLYFFPKIEENGFYHCDFGTFDNFKITYSYDYESEESRSYEFSYTHDATYNYYHNNILLADISWVAKKSGDVASKMSNFKLTFKGNIILNSLR